jgi:hypothetical protein
MSASEHANDQGFQLIVDELSSLSPEFAAIWARGEVGWGGQLRKVLAHPTAGELTFESTQLRVPSRPDLTIVMLNPLPGTDTAAKMEWLTSPEGRRTTLHRVSGDLAG